MPKVIQHIKIQRYLSQASIVAGFLLSLLVLATFYPLESKNEHSTEAATGSAQSSSLTLDVASSVASVELTVDSSEGTFSSSDTEIAFSVVTNNFSGYTLSIAGNDDTGVLSDGEDNSLTSIPSAVSEEDFSAKESTVYNGMWGYRPSRFNSAVNVDYLPAPVSEASILDVTSVANNTANDYTIALGARADFTNPAGVYNNTFTIVAVSNPINYSIAYDSNTTDFVSGMPGTQSASTSATSITLSSNAPEREHYSFKGWCSVKPTTTDGDDECGGTVYLSGAVYGIDKTTLNNTTLYAMWEIDKFDQVTRYRYQNADGTYPVAYTAFETKTVNYGDTYSWNTSQISGFNTAHYQTTSVAEYTVTSAKTNSIDIPRTTYALTINKNDNYIASVTGAGNYRWGQTVAVSATTTVNGTFTAWSQTAGTSVTLGSSASFSFAMPVSNITLYADGKPKNLGKMQEFTVASCNDLGEGLTYALTDIRDNEEYYFAKLKDGKCWMQDNLRLGSTSTIALTPADTNIAANYTLPASGVANFDTTNGYTNAAINIDSKNKVDANGNKYGAYYNYCAASAGQICMSFNSGISATADICPKGWRMPTGGPNGEISALSVAYGGLAGTMGPSTSPTGAVMAVLLRETLKIPLSGSFNDASVAYRGTNGYFWSSTYSGSTGMFSLALNVSNVYPQGGNDRSRGFSVRCILNDKKYMQDVTAADVAAMAEGETAVFKDKRDDNTYTVAKINGNLWMTQNLAFAGTILTPADSNVTTARTISWGNLTSGNDYSAPRMTASSAYGAWYNYAGATAGTIVGTSNTTEASESICPVGWRLPTYSEMSGITSYASVFSPVTGGYYQGKNLSSNNIGLWWSSTAINGSDRQLLQYRNSLLNMFVSEGSVLSRGRYGVYIRCIHSS